MLERKTLVVRGYTEAPLEVIGAALQRLEGSPKTFSERAEYVLAELHRQGYRIKRR
jgi:hypothetical protein